VNAVEELRDVLAAHSYGCGDLKACVEWAVDRLVRDEDDGDENVILLASSADESETEELSRRVVRRYLSDEALNEAVWAGRLLAQLYDRHRAGAISIAALEPIIYAMYRKLEHPDWLVMLSRNCEYATDVEPFVKPFEDEFRYVSELWRQSKSMEEFESKYDRRISDSHDIR
jgi:hypothetical protein